MARSEAKEFNSSLAKKVARLLAGLKHDSAGSQILRHIDHLLKASELERREIELAYIELLKQCLAHLYQQLSPHSPLRVQIRLIQMQLTPPLTAVELTTLRQCLDTSQESGPADAITPELVTKAIAPLFDYPPDGSPTPVIETQEPPETPFAGRWPDTSPSLERPEQRVDAAYRQHLHEKSQNIHQIQQTLTSHLNEAIQQNDEFGALLAVEMDAIAQAETIQELHILRRTLLTEVEKLKLAQSELARKLENSKNYLQLIEEDSHELDAELKRVHLLSLTDDLTGLPNRRAFMRRLEDEVGRVQRYGSTLSLVLIDLDDFKSINDSYGHSGGDEVLKTYAADILSIFRHHDLVARYGGEEFAVLLPNTTIEGAVAAVEKVHRRAAQTSFEYENQLLPVPSFSAGVALYQAGETPTDLIERADTALYQAKRKGRNRTEIANSDESRDNSGQ